MNKKNIFLRKRFTSHTTLPSSIIFGSMVLALFSPSAYSELPVILNNFGAPVKFQGANVPGVPFSNAYGGHTLQIDQFDDRAILHWETFNVSKNNEVLFNQPSATSIALNRVLGNVNAASIINGRISANGRVFIINHDGIIFGENAVVNTRSLLASTLDIEDNIFIDTGFENAVLVNDVGQPQLPAFFKNFARDMGAIKVIKGAKIKATAIKIAESDEGIEEFAFGRVMMFAPEIINEGEISAQGGQIILAAAEDEIYLGSAEKNQSDMRGLVVGIKTGGNVTNLGSLIAERGNISLLGLAVNQNGVIRATTSTALNGSILLQAQDLDGRDIGVGATEAGGTFIWHERGGNLTLGENSVTEIIADMQTDIDGNIVTASDALLQKASKIELAAEKITLKSGSRITATGGDISIEASSNPVLDAAFNSIVDPDLQNASIVIESGTIIDASGDDTALVSVARNFVQVDARGNELADSPLQQGGAISGKTLTVDIRKDSDFLNITGAIAGIERGINERLSAGGNVSIKSTGNITVEQGAIIDISGGAVNYSGALVGSSQLVTAGGVVHDISEADKDLRYVGVLDDILVEHNKWGVTKQYQTAFAYFEQGYTQGYDAGVLELNASGIHFDGDVLASTTAGIHQQYAPEQLSDGQFNALLRNYKQMPVGGKLVIKHLNKQLRDIIIGEAEVVAADNEHPISVEDALVLAPKMFDHNGISRIDIDNVGRIIVNRPLHMQAYSEVKLQGTQVLVKSDIHSAGGEIKLTASLDIDGLKLNSLLDDVFPVLKDASTSLVAIDGNIDVSGYWVNGINSVTGQSEVVPVVIQGGDISISSDRDVRLTASSLLNVSGGAYLNTDGKFKAGNGGEIRLSSANSDDDLRPASVLATLDIQGELRGFGIGKGGKLIVEAENIHIHNSGAGNTIATDFVLSGADIFSQRLDEGSGRNVLLLDADITQLGGFSHYEFNALGSSATDIGVVVAAGTEMNLLAATPVIDSVGVQLSAINAGDAIDVFSNNSNPLELLPTGTLIDAFTQTAVLADYERDSVDLILSNFSEGMIEIGTGAAIQGVAGAGITLQSKNNIYIDGLISAPAGEINISIAEKAGLSGVQSQIYLADNARLEATGVAHVNPEKELALISGRVLDAGTVNLSANSGSIFAQTGASIKVDAVSETFAINQNGLMLSTLDHGNAGTISFRAAESFIYAGKLSALAAAGSGQNSSQSRGQGGQLLITLEPNTRGVDEPVSDSFVNEAIYRGEYVAVVEDYIGNLPTFADDVAAELRGKAYIPVEQVRQGGFDSLHVTVRPPGIGNPDLQDSVSVIEFRSNQALALDRQLILDAAVFRAVGDIDVSLLSPYVALGSSYSDFQLDGTMYDAEIAFDATTATNKFIDNFTEVIRLTPTPGDGRLLVEGQLIELVGEMVTQGFGMTGERLQADGSLAGAAGITFIAQQDLRLRGIRQQHPDSLSFDGLLRSASDISISAQRIYPVTLTDFELSVEGDGGAIEFIKLAQSDAQAPLSIGGGLNVSADYIQQGSNLYAPLGRLQLNAGQQLVLTDNSLTSSSGFGVAAPFFTTQPGGDLVYVTPDGDLEADIVFTESLSDANYDRLLPEQFILLNSSTINVQQGARFDIRGGSDARATEFVPGPGGSRDILLADLDRSEAIEANNAFAILPGFGEFAPYDPVLSAQAVAIQGINIGDTIILEEAGAGLAAGSYAILPARYALFGGYLVTPVESSQNIYSGLNFSTADGSVVVAGHYGVAGTDIVSSRSQGFAIASADIVHSRAEYLQTPLTDIYTEGNLRSPNDAGTLTIDVQNNLLLAGQLIATENSDSALPGRGSQVNIVSDIIAIVTATQGTNVKLTAAQLTALGADSVLIGGRSDTIAEGLLIESVASEVIVEAGVILDVPELILVADVINVQSEDSLPTRLQSTHAANGEQQRLIIAGDPGQGINGDAAIVAVSNRTLTLERIATTGGETGMLTFSSAATLQANGSVVADAAGNVRFSGQLDAVGALVNLGASHISLGETDAEGISTGLVLSNDDLSRLDGARLRLRSGNEINIYGQLLNTQNNTELTFAELDLDSRGLVGHNNAGDNVVLSAALIALSNTSGSDVTDSGSITNGSVLSLSTQQLKLADGKVKIQAYETVAINASDYIFLTGEGELLSEATLNVTTPVISAKKGADYTITAQDKKLTIGGGDEQAPFAKETGMAASLLLQAAAIDYAGRVVLPSGHFAIHQLGDVAAPIAGNNITIQNGAIVNVAGITQPFGPRTLVTDGGRINLLADTGDIIIEAGAGFNTSAGALMGEAGSLEFNAALGEVNIAAATNFTSTGNAGDFILDSNTLNVAGISDALAYTRLSELLDGIYADKRHIHLRNQGIEHAQSLTVRAHDVHLVSDTDSIVVRGTIDASGQATLGHESSTQKIESIRADGGSIVFAAGDTIDIESTAVLLAKGMPDEVMDAKPTIASKGGKVEFFALDADTDDAGASNDRVNLKAGAIIDVSGGDNPVYGAEDFVVTAAQNLGGKVLVHTRLVDAATGDFVAGELAATIIGAAKADLVVTSNTEIVDGIIDNSDITALYDATKLFMDNTVANVNDFRVTPGLQVWSATDLILKDEWNFYGVEAVAGSPGLPPFIPPTPGIAGSPRWYFGDISTGDGITGYLSLLTAGELILEASITDAFYIKKGFALFGIPDLERLSTSAESWSYNIVAGATLSSANVMDVQAASGNILLTAALDIRTGTGDINLTAGNNINFVDADAAVYTTGYDRKISSHIASFLADEAIMSIWLGGGDIFPVDGGSVSVFAGGDIVSAQAPSVPTQWQPRIGSTEVREGGGGIVGDAGFVPAHWGIASDRFSSGFGTLGGGILELTTKGDINNIVMAVPTTGRTIAGSVYASGFLDANETTEVAGGGILKVDVGGDAHNAQYYLGDGVADIRIAGDSGSVSAGTVTEIYTGFDAQLKLTAGNELNLTTVTDIGVIAISDSQGVHTGNGGISGSQAQQADYFTSAFFTYSASNMLDLHALSGKVTISSVPALALPPVFKISSHSDDLIINADDIAQYPSSVGQIELIAANDITVATTSFSNAKLTQAGYQPGMLSNIQQPMNIAVIESSIEVQHAIHKNDDQQSLIIAREGSITTTDSGFWDVEFVESLYMEAGLDISNLSIQVQNSHANDISSFIAGRDIRQPTQRDNKGKFISSNDSDSDSVTQFEISGPGTVEFLAGRKIDLGTSDGIETVGNNKNRFLPTEGADLILMAGVGGDLDIAAFAQAYFKQRLLPISVTKIEKITGSVIAVDDLYTDGENFYSSDAEGYLVLLAEESLNSVGLAGINRNDGISTKDRTVLVEGIEHVIKAEVSGDIVDATERVDYRQNLSAYLQQRDIDIQGNDAVATFLTLDKSEQRLLLTNLLFTELREGGTYAKLSGTDDYSRGFDVINSLFPQHNPEGAISLLLSQVQTLDGGDINMLVPGGLINAGSASTDIIKKGVTDLGIFTAQAGDVSIFVEQDLLVNSSRVFSLKGDLLVWASNGNIDAGKGAKTVTSLPSTNWQLDVYGNLTLVTDPAVSGSGLQGTDVALFAPQGVVNAGDAGISARGNAIIGAPKVLGADNIDVGGVSVGVPTASAGVGASVAGAGDATKSATDIAESATDFGADDEGSTTLGILSVNVEGFGACPTGDPQCQN